MKKSESRHLKDALGKPKEISTDEAQPKVYEVVEHEIPAVAAIPWSEPRLARMGRPPFWSQSLEATRCASLGGYVN